MANMDYSQVGLPRFHVQDEIRSPLQETMTNLEANMAELRRSQAQFMEEMNNPSQEKTNFKSEVDELAIDECLKHSSYTRVGSSFSHLFYRNFIVFCG